MYKKIAILGILAVVAVSLTGCSNQVPGVNVDEIVDKVYNRINKENVGITTKDNFQAADITATDDLAVTDDSTFGDDVAISGELTLSGGMVYDTEIITATTTLTNAYSGKMLYLDPTNGFGSTITLPAVAAATGTHFTFVVKDAFATFNWVIDSAEGDNIEGTLIVAGAVVDCAAEDQINLVADGENIGDYVELYSDGDQWYLGDSGVLTASKMTCTDPS